MTAPGEAREASAFSTGERICWLLAVAAAIVLRGFRLDEQVLVGDEIHMLSQAARFPVARILGTFDLLADPCPPLAALTRLAMQGGLVVDERMLRAPSLLAGVLLVALAPWLLRRRLGTAPGLWYAWLLATSPALVIYSRIVRPYSLLTLLGVLALFAFDRWWQEPRLLRAAGYALPAALAIWLHPGALPFVAAPPVAAAAARTIGVPRAPAWRAILGAAASLGALLLVFYASALPALVRMVRIKSGFGRPGARGLRATAELLAGSAWPGIALVVLLLALLGAWRLALRLPALGWIAGAAVAAQLAAAWISAPAGIANPVILARYLLIALPVLLLWVATALAEALGRLRRRLLRGAAAAALVGALLAAGPLPWPGLLDSPLLPVNDLVGFYRAPSTLRSPRLVPAFYRQLARERGREAVVELTGAPTWVDVALLAAYQRVHGRPLLQSLPEQPELFAEGLALRHFVAAEPRALLAAPARWLVVHLHYAREIQRLDQTGSMGAFLPGREALEHFAQVGRDSAARFERLWGAPDFRDRTIVVWDLERLRRLPAPAAP